MILFRKQKLILSVICLPLLFMVATPHLALAVTSNDTPVFKSKIFNPTSGAVTGSFYNAVSVSIDASDNVYISDRFGHISKYNSSGDFLVHWGGPGNAKTGNGEFGGTAYGGAFDLSGNVFVVDDSNNRVQKFDSDGVYLSQFGSYGSGNGSFWAPNYLTSDSLGNIYVSDHYNFRVQKFNSSGNFILKFGSMGGSGNGQFNSTEGIALDSTGNIYVADLNNNRIQKFNAAGNFLSKWGSLGSGDGQLNHPLGIAMNSDNTLLVVDSGNNRIQKFTSTGTYLSQWGSYGQDVGQFNFPYSIAINSIGDVFVADYYNNRVQQFTSAGVFIKQWGSGGTGNGQFSGAEGVSLDSNGNLFVVDTYNSRVQKFNSSGIYLSQWGSVGSENGQFRTPMGLTIDSANNVYVAEQGNSRIQKFDTSGNYIAKWGSYGSGNGQFNNPVQINNDSLGNIYVADSNNRRIQKFDATGNYLTKWTTDGSIAFAAADGVAFDSIGNLYVADYDCHVHKFSASGTFLARWGSCGNGEGKFREPLALALDSYDNVYVADNQNNRIQKFDSSGNYLTQWGSWGESDGNFVTTHGIYIDTTDTIYVTSMSRVQVFGDTSAPTGTVTYVNDTEQHDVNLTLTGLDNHDTDTNLQMKVANNASFDGASWESFSASKTWSLASGDGVKTVYVKFKDKGGNESTTYNSASTTFDTTGPESFTWQTYNNSLAEGGDQVHTVRDGGYSSSDKVALSWKKEGDETSEVDKYKVYLREKGGKKWKLVGEVNGDKDYVTVDKDPGEYEWRVVAYDTVGNTTDSDIFTFTIVTQVEGAPKINLVNDVSPTDGVVYLGVSDTLTVTGTAEKDTTVIISINSLDGGIKYQEIDCDSSGEGDFTCTDPALVDANYLLRVFSRNKAGEEGPITSVTLNMGSEPTGAVQPIQTVQENYLQIPNSNPQVPNNDQIPSPQNPDTNNPPVQTETHPIPDTPVHQPSFLQNLWRRFF